MPRATEVTYDYKLLNVLPVMQLSQLCDILWHVCRATVVDVHFNGRRGMNLFCTVPKAKLTADEEALITELIPSGGAGLNIMEVPPFKVNTRKRGRQLRLFGFPVDHNGRSSPPLSQVEKEALGFGAADWLAGEGVGGATLCSVEYAETAKPDGRAKNGDVCPPKVLNIVLQLPTQEAVQRAMSLTQSRLDMLTVLHTGGTAFLYVSQPGDKPSWYYIMVKRTASHDNKLSSWQMIHPVISYRSHLPDEHSDDCSRVPAAGCNMPQHMPSLPSPTTTPQNDMVWSHNPYNLE